VNKGQGVFCSRECFYKEQGKVRYKKNPYSNCKGGKRADLGGQYFRSSWEANYARVLNWFIANGNDVKSWEYEPDVFEFPVKRGSKFYTPDFKVHFSDGHHEYHEVKGWMDKVSATKIKRMGIHYKDEKIVVIGLTSYKDIAKKFMGSIPKWEKGAKHSY